VLGVEDWAEFSLSQADAEHPATRGLHIGFGAPSRDHVDRFWQVGTAAGYRDDGAPGPRPQYSDDYYGSFLLDPDGNSAEAVHHDNVRPEGVIDHIWIRVADLGAAKLHYERLAVPAGFRLDHDTSDRVRFEGAGASFSLVAGTPTENLHLTFRG
jgi:hypothetical protein